MDSHTGESNLELEQNLVCNTLLCLGHVTFLSLQSELECELECDAVCIPLCQSRNRQCSHTCIFVLLEQGETDSTAEQSHQVTDTEVLATVGGTDMTQVRYTDYLAILAKLVSSFCPAACVTAPTWDDAKRQSGDETSLIPDPSQPKNSGDEEDSVIDIIAP